MKMQELVEASADIQAQIKELATEAGFENPTVTKTTINNLYDEFVITAKNDQEYDNDRGFTQSPTMKRFRTLIKEKVGEESLREKTVTGMVLNDENVRAVFQLKGHK